LISKRFDSKLGVMWTITKSRAAVAVAALGCTLILPAPARAAVSDCTVNPPPGQHGGPTATATCPAGAGTFTFRVAVTCADAYPNLHFYPANGPWVRASLTSPTTSSLTCHGYVPGSGFVWEATIQEQE
jgi:hypothetical protein